MAEQGRRKASEETDRVEKEIARKKKKRRARDNKKEINTYHRKASRRGPDSIALPQSNTPSHMPKQFVHPTSLPGHQTPPKKTIR